MKWIVLLVSLPAAAIAGEPQAGVLADNGSPATLRAAIRDLISDFGPRYPLGEEFLRRLDAIEQQPGSAPDSARAAFGQLQRAALIANPLLQAQPILFVVREQYLPDHHNTETIFHTGEPNNGSYRPGGPLKILDPVSGRTSVLLDPGPEGLVRDPEVHFDGRKIVFSMRKARDENYSIYELEVDPQQGWAAVPGSLRRLTAERDATDIDPVYLPDGKIVFSSTREPKYCHCNMHIMANVSDVYQGTHMQGVRRGDVASLRVVESVEKRVWTGPLWHCAQFAQGSHIGDTLNRPAISWAGFEVKRILGTVPVEADGSASFEVPAERFVYFQLLDRDGMMVATMRSGTQVQPGETLACIGCHDNRLTMRPPPESSLALQRPPSKLTGWHGPIRSFGYLQEIQPIWNQHCVSCHDFGQEAEAKLVLAGDKELVFNASYVELFQNWGRESAWLNTVGLGLAPIKPAYATGAHRSRLVELLKRGHYEVRLSPEEMDRIVTWIDLGGPYYPDYACAHPNHVAGRAPLSIAQLNRLAALTGLPLSDGQGNPGFAGHRLWLSFDRPEVSPCLRKLDQAGDVYREALAIIQAGQDELRKNPEADMAGFRPCEEHQVREAKYQALREREASRRQALAEGRKAYDVGMQK